MTATPKPMSAKEARVAMVSEPGREVVRPMGDSMDRYRFACPRFELWSGEWVAAESYSYIFDDESRKPFYFADEYEAAQKPARVELSDLMQGFLDSAPLTYFSQLQSSNIKDTLKHLLGGFLNSDVLPAIRAELKRVQK